MPELQRAFAAGVFAEDVAVTRHILDGRFPAARHLQVYRNNVFESLVGALKAVYPVVERLVGTGFFAYAA
ncbi:MAG TPA: DNA-binding domain-containing protein, partial [Burkholderiales bacterium]|nr:DNA-binding domain-containing protein [Burkholderiales bacterium]